MKKRILSMLLVIVMVVGMMPSTVFAAMGDNLCEHHAEHTAECGYVEGVSDCAYHCDVCLGHDHGEEVTEEVTEPAVECTCDSDDPEWHAPFCALYEMPEDPECYCTELCDPDQPNEWCDVCYFDADACTGSDEEQGVAYATTPTYIASLGIAQDADKDDAINELSGHTVIDQDLNKGCGSSSDYIYMGYKTTTNPSEAITGIFIRTGENPPASATFDGVTAYLVGGSYEANTGVDNVVDLNEDAGGAYIYVYVTRDTSRAPVTEITFSSSNSKSGYTTPNVDLNQGVGGSDDIYLHYKQYSATAYINYYYLGENFEVVHKQVSGTLKHHLDQMTNTPSGASDVIYDGKTAAKIGWREDASVQNQGSSLTTPSVTLETSGKNYYAAYRLSFGSTTSLTFDANGGSGAPNNLVRTNDTRYVTAGKSAFIIEKMSFTIPTTAPTHADKCKFLGWSTNKNAATAAYKSGQTIQVDLNTTLYAVYQKTHSYNQNGFCTECEAGYQPAELNSDGYYEIGNAGQLFWFAQLVNGGDRTANAILIDDIDLEDRPWTPIGATGEASNNFRGHFDGDGHTIEGLYVDVDRAGVGFFGEVRTGTVENFTIYGEVVMDKEYDYVSGVIGSACGLNSNAPDHNGATIRNITSYVNLTAKAHGIGMVGGFIGYANHETLIENCSWYGTFDAGEYRVDSGAGGFVGRIYDSASVTIRNCAAYGTVKTAYQSGTHSGYDTIYIGGFLSYSPSGAATVLKNNLWAGQIINNTNLDAANAHLSAYGTMNSAASKTNCYALEGTPYVTTGNDNADGITTVTVEQLASGEIAYKLGSAWGQNLGENGDAYPVLGGETVYEVKDCKDKLVGYSNSEGEKAHDFDANGFCTNCGGYEPAELNADGVYEIGNAGQLYWFAQQVNGGDKGINGKLTRDITVNEGVLDANGELNSGSENFRVWTPIGYYISSSDDKVYTGTFDGGDHTVSGLYFNDSTTNQVGLFGYVYSGKVQNVGVIDSYLHGNQYVGGVVGINASGSEVTNCYNTGVVNGSSEIGGVVGRNSNGDVRYCCNTGSVSGSGNSVGGVVGYNDGVILNCYNIGDVSGSSYVGGVAGYNNSSDTVINSYNIGKVGGSGQIGSVVGSVVGNNNGTVNNCYYDSSVYSGSAIGTGAGTVTNVEGKTTAQFASGEVAYLLGDAFGQTIGTEDHPVLGGATVYAVTCGGNPIYSNSNENYTEHTNVNGFCSVCGEMLCDHSGNENKYDCTKDFVCSVCSAVITPAAEAHTPGEDDNNCATAVECTVCGTAVVAAKTHAFDSDGKCTNDGCTVIGYMLWVGGEQVTSKNLTITDENGGTATYDPANNILTLDNYSYEGAGHTWNEPYGDGYFMQFSAAICYGGTDPIQIVLNGASTVTHTGTSDKVYSCGIYTNGSIEILDGSADGIGSLTAIGGPTEYISIDSYGVYARFCSITVTGGSLTGIGGEAKYSSSSTGVYAHNCSINVTGGTLTGIGGKAESSSYGVWADGDIVISGSGQVVATGGDSDYGSSYGVATYDSIQVTGGSLTANGGDYALYAKALTTGAGYGIVTPVGGVFKSSTVYDGDQVATEVVIEEKPVVEYDLWVGGEQVTSENLVISGTTGTATYDPEKNTLTLDNYSYEGEGYYNAAIYYGGSGTLELALVNNNSITHAGNSYFSYGINADNGSIRISGDGKLTATGGEAHNGDSGSYGIRASEDITILGGTVTATGSKAAGDHSSDSTGIFAQGQITITGGTVTATASEVSGGYSGSSTGIYAYKGIHISGGTVTATGGTATDYDSYGVSTYGSLTVSGGSLTATGGNVTGDDCCSYGVYAYDGLTMGEGIGIMTPVGSYFESYTIYDGDQIATEVVIDKGYTVSVNATANGTVSGAGLYAEGTEVKLTVTPNYGYGLESLTVMQGETKIEVSNNSFIMPAGNVTVTATFVEVKPYEIWIGGTQVTSANAADVFGDGKVSFTYSQKGEPSVLTLNNYTYEGEGYLFDTENYYGDHRAAICYLEMHPLTLVLNGDSTITRTDGAAGRSYGIYVGLTTAELTVTGTGSLTVNGGAAEHYSYGVYTDSGLTINSGSLTVNGGNTTNEYEGSSYGLLMNYGGGLTVNSGSLTVNGGDVTGEYGSSFGMYLPCGITVNGGSLTANGGTASLNSYAVQTYGLTMGEGFGILTPVGGRYNGQDTVDDAAGEPAKTVVIGAGHTVTVNEFSNGTVTGAGIYKAGANVTLAFTPEPGCEIKSVTAAYGDNIPVNGTLSANKYTFSMPEADVTLTVTAERVFTPYDINIGGQWFSDKTLTITDENGGTATYDPETNTLTLDGYSYEGAGYEWKDDFGTSYIAAIYYGGTQTLNLVLNGDSEITHTGSADVSYGCGLYSSSNVVVDETDNGGSLTITGGTADADSYGVYLERREDENGEFIYGDLTLIGGSLTATGGKSYQSSGVCAENSIEVSGGSLAGTGGEAKDASYGVLTDDITVTDGTVTGIGGAASGSSSGSYGVHASIISVTGGTVTGTGGKSSGSYSGSYGVNVNHIFTVSGGSLSGTGGEASGYNGKSYGAHSAGVFTVTGGNVAGVGGVAVRDSCGVYVGYGNVLRITDGSLTGTGDSYGVFASKLTLVNGVYIMTPEGGSYNTMKYTVFDTDGQIAKEVKIAAKPAPTVTLNDGKLTITNAEIEADEKAEMIIMVAGYTDGQMTGCQVIEDVTGVTEIDLTFSGDTVKVFFLKPGTYAPLFACAEL